MFKLFKYISISIVLMMLGCNENPKIKNQLTAADILGIPSNLLWGLSQKH